MNPWCYLFMRFWESGIALRNAWWLREFLTGLQQLCGLFFISFVTLESRLRQMPGRDITFLGAKVGDTWWWSIKGMTHCLNVMECMCLWSWEISCALWREPTPTTWRELGAQWNGTFPWVSATALIECFCWECSEMPDAWLCPASILISIHGSSGTILSGAECEMIKFTTKSTSVWCSDEIHITKFCIVWVAVHTQITPCILCVKPSNHTLFLL